MAKPSQRSLTLIHADAGKAGSVQGRQGSDLDRREPSGLQGTVQLMLLAGFELRCKGERVPVHMNSQRLLAFLALHPRPLLRNFVAGQLWLDSTEDHAAASLRSTLWRLGRLGFSVVSATPSHVGIDESVEVDLHAAASAARLIIEGSSAGPDLGGIQAALGSDLLPDWYEDWLSPERERYRQMRLRALERLCLQLTAIGSFGRAVEAGLAAVTAEPLRESAHRCLISAFLKEGNRGQALRQYQSFRRLLIDEIGVEPSEGLADLVMADTSKAKSDGKDIVVQADAWER